jgi:hypothetical protein
MTSRQVREDARNLSLIGGAALAGIALTAVAFARATPPVRSSSRVVIHVAEAVTVAPMSASDRLYGTVTTRAGERYEGFLRWDRNEGSWTDVLDASKERDGRTTQTGVRFGHVRTIERLGRGEALLTLRSGERVRMSGRATDLGDGLRALRVDRPGRDGVELGWRDLDVVEFMPAPVEAHPTEGRIRGVLQTRSGASFGGAVSWDVDEIYSGDVLDGDVHGARQRIPFGEIAAIERDSRRAARVFLRSGEELVLEGTNDVDDSNAGIAVSDPELGEVKVSWDEFDRVVFDALDAPLPEFSFDGGSPIRGTVLTESGERFRGHVRWDADESSTWEMLNGEADGVSFQIEFSRISRVERTALGARVELRDGRTFELSGSNDVDDGNRGILIDDGSRTVRVSWDDFVELRLEE